MSNGTVEALKWLALALMTLDHINKYLFGEASSIVFDIGRLAMPLFGFVLAFNLARPGALESGLYVRTMKRLALFGLIATPFVMGLGGLLGGWWPLNIMFLLLVATGTIYLIERRDPKYVLLLMIGGGFAEFWWPGLAFVIAAWFYCKTPSKRGLVLWVIATASLALANLNFWALAALPLIFAASRVNLTMPRFRHVFYTYYPAHLAVLLSVKHILS